MASFYKIDVGPDHVGAHLKIYLKDITRNSEVKELLEDLPAVDHVNITEKGKKSDLTLYPYKAYEIEEVKADVSACLDKYFELRTPGAITPLAAAPLPANGGATAPEANPLKDPDHLTVFLSYTWDGKPHQDWVLALADQLQSRGGVRVLLDQYEIRAGKNVTHFMERAIVAADKVVMIMTPNYKVKADSRTGGAGYEYSMISTELYNAQGAGKFIPVARVGKYYECSPTFIKSLISLDMTDDAKFEENFIELLRLIHDEPAVVAPPIGSKPIFPTRTPTAGPMTATVTGVTSAPISSAPGPLINDAVNLAKTGMPAMAHWTIRLDIKSMADLSLSNFYRQIYKHRIVQDNGQYYLPFVLNDNYKTSHHPDWDFVIPLKTMGARNMLDASALKITKGAIAYEYSEYSDHEMMLLHLADPFTTLLYLLVILKKAHDELHRQPTIEIEVDFNGNRKTVFYLKHSPIPVSRIYGMQTMTIPGNAGQRNMVIVDVNHDSLLDIFNEMYGMFMADSPGSNKPFVELDRATFINVIKKFIDK